MGTGWLDQHLAPAVPWLGVGNSLSLEVAGQRLAIGHNFLANVADGDRSEGTEDRAWGFIGQVEEANNKGTHRLRMALWPADTTPSEIAIDDLPSPNG